MIPLLLRPKNRAHSFVPPIFQKKKKNEKKNEWMQAVTPNLHDLSNYCKLLIITVSPRIKVQIPPDYIHYVN